MTAVRQFDGDTYCFIPTVYCVLGIWIPHTPRGQVTAYVWMGQSVANVGKARRHVELEANA